MSTNLYWKPVLPDDWQCVDSENKDKQGNIKYVIAPAYFDHDGSLSGSGVILTAEDVPYLTGVRDGGNYRHSAQELIDAINKFGAIELALRR